MGDAAVPDSRSLVVRAVRWPLTILKRLLAVIPAVVDMYFVRRLPQQAAGIAYRVLFSLAPLAIVLVSIFGLVLQSDDVRERVVETLVDSLPVSAEGEREVEDAITKLASPASALGLISLLLFVWGATGMMASIRIGLETAMGVERGRPAARSKLVDLILVVGVAALVIVAVALNLATQVVSSVAERGSEWLGIGEGWVNFLTKNATPVLVSMVVVLLLYRFVPARRLRFRDTIAGAIVTALLFLAISLATTFIFTKVSQLSVVYGSLAAALVFLYTVYLYASALLVGAAVAAAWAAPAASGPGEPIVVQVKRAVLGLFVHPSEEAASREDPARAGAAVAAAAGPEPPEETPPAPP